MRRWRLGIAGLVLLLVAGAFLVWWQTRPKPADFALQAVSFDALDGWAADQGLEALAAAFARSCAKLDGKDPEGAMGPMPIYGRIAEWQAVCAELPDTPDSGMLRAYFERYFQPHAVLASGSPEGLFTGYYQPVLTGHREKPASGGTPLYLRPPELVMVDLGQFREDLKGRRIAGEVRNGRLVPFPDRAEIEDGALDGRDLELLWLDDPIGAFFLHIQGSGVVELSDGEQIWVGYAAQNGHPYYAIGRSLIAWGEIPKEEMSLQSLRAWMQAHPDQAVDLMNENASYIFFTEQKRAGAVGSQNVILTADRSLAVDRTKIPLGVPLWLDTHIPQQAGEPRPYRRLMVAQDTGGAIRGAVRGDIFFGLGPEAEYLAGHQNHAGRFYVLLPKNHQLMEVTDE